MAIYEYSCTEWENIQTEMRKIADRKDDGVCKLCGGVTKFKISAPYFSETAKGFYGNDSRRSKTTTIGDGTVTHGKAEY